MPDRTINFGDDAADARYRIQDTSSTGGDFVVAEDLDGGTVLLEYDYSESEWVSRGAVNLSGNDITNAGSIAADTLEAQKTDINNELDADVNTGQGSVNDPYVTSTSTGRCGFAHQQTTVPANTTTSIVDNSANIRSALIMIHGRSGLGDYFSDLLNYNAAAGVTVFQTDERNNPPARTYSEPNNFEISLEVGSECETTAIAIFGDASDPT